jgi:hypothetical protein
VADEQATGEVVEEPIEATLLPIPEEHVERALAAIRTLGSGGEVAGYAMGGAPVKSGPISGTSCTITQNRSDFTCKDSDRT